MRVVGYGFSSDLHCVDCARAAAAAGCFRHQPAHADAFAGVDENGLAGDWVDAAGNALHPMFDLAEGAARAHCGDCGAALLD